MHCSFVFDFCSYLFPSDSAVVDMDSDNEDVDLESYQPLPKSIVNWKSGTVINEEGQERRLADEEVEQFRSILSLPRPCLLFHYYLSN